MLMDVFIHTFPQKKHPPPSSQSPEMVALTPPGPPAKNTLYPPIFPTCFPMETGKATHKRTHLQHIVQSQLLQILPDPQKQRPDKTRLAASSGTGRMQGKLTPY